MCDCVVFGIWFVLSKKKTLSTSSSSTMRQLSRLIQYGPINRENAHEKHLRTTVGL